MRGRTNIASTLKSSDTEEWFDLVFYRPLGYGWARLFQKLHIHPNTVTVLSIFIGIASGFFFYSRDIVYNCIGVLLLIWANTFDSADGQLARMTGQTSQLGRVLDGIASSFWFVAIYLALIFRLFPEYGYWIWAIAALAGYSHTRQTSAADYYRNIHLFFLKGKSHSEADDSQTLKTKYKTLSWKNYFWQKLFVGFYANYTRKQERNSPNYQTFKKYLSNKYGKDIPPDLRERFRIKSLPLMKFCNMLSFNLRASVLCISVLWNRPIYYFIFEITLMNILLIYTVYRHETISKKFAKETI